MRQTPIRVNPWLLCLVSSSQPKCRWDFLFWFWGLLADQVIVPLLCRIYPLRKRLPVVGSMRKDEGGAVPIVNVCILCVRRVSCNDPIPFESVCVTIGISRCATVSAVIYRCKKHLCRGGQTSGVSKIQMITRARGWYSH